MSAIVTLTLNPALDKSSTIEHVVADRKLRCGAPSFDPGGGGINVSRAIHELGGQSTAYWTCGGPMGQMLKQLLDDEGVDHRPIAIDDVTRENLVIHEESTGRQFRFGFPGAKLTDVEVRRCIDLIDAGKAEAIFTSIGRGGAILTTASEHLHLRSPTVEIRSRIGAGDSTLAGRTFALSRGNKLADAARFGVAAGAAAVMTAGTRLCRRADVERLYQEMTQGQLAAE